MSHDEFDHESYRRALIFGIDREITKRATDCLRDLSGDQDFDALVQALKLDLWMKLIDGMSSQQRLMFLPLSTESVS